ncbi:hypothetical protein ELE36_11180 [Pseudolysobacter antarcticus]|uniref:Uncharacterized protein n=1 Tax=Pseudolysobacter antarcticus TaxID=2511995 RepID=A0A411HK13_9GAMM|nr:O-methyltransferase [Pseudolysobacter antarcticus]QBB70872.1 hypothetical protein ELE36_11180 [Pseudolysobacter antarcticus]
MASFNLVNYSLRPSKSIQRALAFDGVRTLQGKLDYKNLLYVGFGSIWFTDFHLAHRSLSVQEMVSIEVDPVGYVRALFNCPFRTVKIKKGYSYEILPTMYGDAEYRDRPWMMWLDYDKALSESSVEDIRLAIEMLPADSVFLVTFKCIGGNYGKPKHRHKRIKILLGDVVPDTKVIDDFQDAVLPDLMASLVLDFMKSAAAQVARPGGFVPSFRMAYRDQTPMVTVGGVLPRRENVDVVKTTIKADEWSGMVSGTIVAPHLTTKESTALQAELPSHVPLDRNIVQQLGFDLDDDQIEAFQKFYRFYPSFAQVVS